MEHEEADRTNYEQEHPHHPTETQLLDRMMDRTREALRKTSEAEDRMARNLDDPKTPAK